MKARRTYRRKCALRTGIAMSGTARASHVNAHGVRVITDFEVLSVSLVNASQVLHPSWRVVKVTHE